MPYDLLIQNGIVVDGSGAPRYHADVAVQSGRVVDIGRVTGPAKQTVNADGLVVAPGFFDLHTHYDCQLLWDPLATSSCWHGVTTVVTGNCGFGIAPARPGDSEYLMRLMARVEGISLDVLREGLDFGWESFGDWVDRLRQGLGVNMAAQVPHCALRYYVMGPASYEREATDEEIEQMKALLREAMLAGAMGFSSSQTAHHTGGYGEPVPSRMSSPKELLELCGVLGEFESGIIGINPNPGAGIIGEEFGLILKDAVKRAGKPALWNQLMHRWDKPDEWRQMLKWMEDARVEGADVYAVARCQSMDMEFNLRATYTFDRLETWKDILDKSHEEKRRLFSDESLRDKLRQEWDTIAETTAGRRLDLLEVARTVRPENENLEGEKVVDLATREGKHMADFVLDLSLSENLDTQFVFIGSMNGDAEAVGEMIQHPLAVPGVSDAGAHLDMDCGVDFTGVLLGKWVREKGVMSLEEGVRRLTGMPAGILGLKDRGLLQAGAAADIVLFDPSTIKALKRETWDDLPGGGKRIVQRAEGVHKVIVNGEVLLDQGEHTGALPGQVLSPGGFPSGKG